jgi:hypothetical protein
VSGSPIKRQTEVKNTLPIGRIEGSKTTHTPLIRYFINDIGQFLPHAPAAKTARTIPKDVTDLPIRA